MYANGRTVGVFDIFQLATPTIISASTATITTAIPSVMIWLMTKALLLRLPVHMLAASSKSTSSATGAGTVDRKRTFVNAKQA